MGAKGANVCRDHGEIRTGSHVRSGSKADVMTCRRHVRFSPDSGHPPGIALRLLRAKSGNVDFPETSQLTRFGTVTEVIPCCQRSTRTAFPYRRSNFNIEAAPSS